MKPLRSTVAIVEARPETVREDYRRLLSLAGLEVVEPGRCLLVDGTRPAGGSGVPVSPPWQLGATLAAPQPGAIFALGSGGRASGADRTWSGILAAAGTGAAEAGAWERRRTGTEGLAALAEALPGGAALPRGLTGKPLLVAAGMTVGGGWPVRAGLELMARLVAPPHLRRRRCRVTGAEVVAESLALIDAECGLAGTVVDGVRWHLHAGRWRRGALLGNLLLAGRDPVAVDATACRLAGVDPRRVFWLRLCAERGLGRIDPDQIDVAGRDDLLKPDLDLPPHLLEPAGEGVLPGVADGRSWLDRWRIRGAAPRPSGWDDLGAVTAVGGEDGP